MIEFSGELSEKNKNYLLKKCAIVGFISMLIPGIFLGIPLIIGIIMWDWLLVVFIPVLLLAVVLAPIMPYINKKKTIHMLTPKKISINKDGSVRVEFERNIILKDVTSIKKVVDNGEWYNIILHFPKLDWIICQKDLIAKGTLKDFEKIFEGKIERKYKKDSN